ncbi:MAG: NAD(P)/FAD-dependent oxidoreductase [Candidatus Bathyarchaeia archaeon]
MNPEADFRIVVKGVRTDTTNTRQNSISPVPSMKDVIVIGAGPAGATAAKVIASSGFEVQLVEKRKPSQPKVCGGGMPYDLSRILSLPEHVVEKRVSYQVHHFPWGKRVSHEQHVTVRREVFDNFLAGEAVKSGAQLSYETVVDSVRKEGKSTVVYARTKGGEVVCTPCKMVIFADGVSTLASKTFPSLGFKATPKNTAIAATYELSFKDNSMDYYDLYYGSQISPWGYGWIFPKRDSLNVGVGCLLSDLRKSQQNIKYLLDRFYATALQNADMSLKDKAITEFGAAMIPLSQSPRIFGPSCLAVGDAAGMVDPLLGCGIVHAVASGRLAGLVALGALASEDFSESYMSRYQVLWQQSSGCRNMKKNEQRARVSHHFSTLDKNTISKMEHLLFFKDCSSLLENLRVLFS